MPSVPSKPSNESKAEILDKEPAPLASKNAGGVRFSSFQGPLPPPDILRQYNDVIPDLAERIVRMTEMEQIHRHECDNRDLSVKERLAEQAIKESQSEIWITRIGQAVGCLLSIGSLAFAVHLALHGQPWQIVTTFAAVPSAALIYAAVRWKSPQKEEGQEKQ